MTSEEEDIKNKMGSWNQGPRTGFGGTGTPLDEPPPGSFPDPGVTWGAGPTLCPQAWLFHHTLLWSSVYVLAPQPHVSVLPEGQAYVWRWRASLSNGTEPASHVLRELSCRGSLSPSCPHLPIQIWSPKYLISSQVPWTTDRSIRVRD